MNDDLALFPPLALPDEAARDLIRLNPWWQGDPRDVERIAALLLGWLSVMWWEITLKHREDKVWEAQAIRCIEAAV